MCIRDRAGTVRDLERCECYRVGGVEDHVHLAIRLSRTITTVSYTHLRAHETVLDLVCRLLLEKKTHYTTLRYDATVLTIISQLLREKKKQSLDSRLLIYT